jgi:Fe-S-cluster-containing dehydrogenase component
MKMENKKDCQSGGCESCQPQDAGKPMDRRTVLKGLATSLVAGAGLTGLTAKMVLGEDGVSESQLKWKEFFKGNFKLMTESDRKATIDRLERLQSLRSDQAINVSDKPAEDGVLFGYAFNISKCRGYMDCVKACIEENNLDRKSGMHYISIFESKKGNFSMESSNGKFFHEVPAEGNFYMGTQCFHCENPPCVKVCPVEATWKEKDGIVVIDYDWCVGCRYCEAACPYFGRRFNWNEPEVPAAELNPNQHYLGNRMRKKGVMEKCTFCVQRSRNGKNPACVEACPTGARVFGNLLDPKSEIRWILANKKVFRLKEDLGTEPKFWYYMD